MLKGKKAVVTGSTSGIGLAIAQELARQGADLVINGFGDADAIERERAGLEKDFGIKAVYLNADLMDEQAARDFIAQSSQALGGIDILVNNAGIQHTDLIEDFPVDKWNAIIALNLSAVFHCSAAALPGMKRQKFGRIINIASAHGLVASANKSAYVAAKHGVVGLTKVTALENAGTGVTCNAICPGWVHTPLVQKQIDALAEREGLDNAAATNKLLGLRQPSGKFVTLEQIAGLCEFFCSPDADEVRGVAWAMDGGTTAA